MASGATAVNDWQTVEHPAVNDWTDVSAPPNTPQPGILSRVGASIGDTLSKTAHNMNVENTLHSVDDLTSGDFDKAIHAVPNPISHMLDAGKALASGNKQAMAEHLYSALMPGGDIGIDTAKKLKDGDFSGAIANLLPFAFAASGSDTVAEAPGKIGAAVGNAADATGTALRGAGQGAYEANKSIPVHGAALAASLVPGVGHTIAAGIEGTNTAVGLYKGAKSALTDRAAANAAAAKQAATDAAIAEQRANGRIAQWQKPGQQTQPTPSEVPDFQPIQPAAATNRAITPQAAPEPAPVAAKPLITLDQIAKQQAGTTFAKLDPARQSIARELAARLNGESTPAASSQPGLPISASPVPPSVAVTPPPAPETASLPQNAVAPPSPSPQSTPVATLADILKNPEFYPPRAKAIPSPADLGYGVYAEMLPDDSSTLGHIAAQNEKAFNAADYAFKNGITNPEIFDKLTPAQRKSFMDDALEHGRAAGNPVPSTKYSTGLEGHTLRLAKAHLEKMAQSSSLADLAK